MPSKIGDLILIRVLHRSLFPQDRPYHLHDRCTAGNRWHVDQTWTTPPSENTQEAGLVSGCRCLP